MKRLLTILAFMLLGVFSANAQTTRYATDYAIQTLTIADSGGPGRASDTTAPTAREIRVTCNDADGCNYEPLGTGMVSGNRITILNVGTNPLYVRNTGTVVTRTGSEIPLTTGLDASFTYDGKVWRWTGGEGGIGFGDLNTSSQVTATHLASPLSGTQGGTGQDSSTWTGVPSVSSGTWSNNSALPNTLGGTGQNSSASTGTPHLLSGTWSFGTLLPESYTTAGLPGTCTNGQLVQLSDGLRGLLRCRGNVWIPATEIHVSEFGILPSNSAAANDTGFAALKTATNNWQARISFSCGVYQFSTGLVLPANATVGIFSETVKLGGRFVGGDGRNCTVLKYTGATGTAITITGWGYELENLAILAHSVDANGIIIALTGDQTNHNRFKNLWLEGPAQGTATGIQMSGSGAGCSCFNIFDNVRVYLVDKAWAISGSANANHWYAPYAANVGSVFYASIIGTDTVAGSGNDIVGWYNDNAPTNYLIYLNNATLAWRFDMEDETHSQVTITANSGGVHQFRGRFTTSGNFSDSGTSPSFFMQYNYPGGSYQLSLGIGQIHLNPATPSGGTFAGICNSSPLSAAGQCLEMDAGNPANFILNAGGVNAVMSTPSGHALTIKNGAASGSSLYLGNAGGNVMQIGNANDVGAGAASTLMPASDNGNALGAAKANGHAINQRWSDVNAIQTTIAGDHAEKFQAAQLTELLTIAAAATTDTALSIPANAIVYAVTVRVVTVIPTAATFTVTGASSGTTFDTAAVSTVAGSTDPGTANVPYNNASSQHVRITPNLQPATATGQVRVTVFYYSVTPPTS